MRATDPVVAILVSDVHLTLKPPAARAESNWLGTQAGYLDQVRKLARDHSAVVVYAGDIFDRWNSPPELINFAIEHLPPGYAVPGQHDLPFHNYDDIHKSAYATLVAANVIEDLLHGRTVVRTRGRRIGLYGFPWNATPFSKPDYDYDDPDDVSIAVIHRYCWAGAHGYPGAPPANQLTKLLPEYGGYNVLHFGDNHKGFVWFMCERGDQWVANCGGFMRRKSDEREYKPFVGLVHANGAVTQHFLDVSKDRWADTLPVRNKEGGPDMEGLIDLITQAGDGALNFAEAVRKYLDANKVGAAVRKFVLEALENS